MITIPTFSPALSARLGGGWAPRAITAVTVKKDEDVTRAALEAASAGLLGGASVALIDVPGPVPVDRRHVPPTLEEHVVLAAIGAGSMALSFCFMAPKTNDDALHAIHESARGKNLVLVIGFERLIATPAREQRRVLGLVGKAPAASVFLMAPLYFEDAQRKIARLVRTMALQSFDLTEDLMPWSRKG
jgi:hypothetical protein